jgi:uncharacterized protein YkwD
VKFKRSCAALAFVALALTGTACTLAPAPPASCPGEATPPTALVSALVQLTNAARASNGLPPLAWNPQLACLAQQWSDHMAASGQLMHRDLGSLFRNPAYSGYHALGENIFEGTPSMTADGMQNVWMNSPDHRANILAGNFSSFGIGVSYANGRVWATEDFSG